jgi:dCMP deaminase
MNNIWSDRFLSLAKNYSTWSKDPSAKIGAVAIDPVTRRVISGGYNGFPRGLADTVERLNDRPTKLKYVVHAEANMIYNATRSGVSLQDTHVFVHGLPICSECAKALIQVGVKKVYIESSSLVADRWVESWKISEEMFKECGVEVEYL